MHYNFTGTSFIEDDYAEPEADPMSGIANLADVMLVFACGLMMALVVYWNLDLPTLLEADPDSMQEVELDEETIDDLGASDSSYQEMGTAYRDAATGKVYVMAPSEDESSS
jgi:hypothetical protein